MEEKILGPLTQSLNTEGESSFEKVDDESDFGYIEFGVIVFIVYSEDSREIILDFFFPLRILNVFIPLS